MRKASPLQQFSGRSIVKARFDPPLAVLLAVAALVLVAAFLRLSGTDWDGGAGLHPDERHMLFISTDLQRRLDAAPAGRSASDQWFDEAGSALNPRGGSEGRSYVYGELPMLVTTLTGRALRLTGWDETMRLGREMAALVDALTVLAVFLLTQPLWGVRAGLLAALLYAAAPTALQLANFFTVDAWLTGAVAWTLVALMAMLRATGTPALLRRAGAAGLCLGLALACKVNAAALILPVLAALGLVAARRGLLPLLAATACGGLATLLAFRLGNPFAFLGPGPLGLTPAPRFLADMRSVLAMGAAVDFPPNWQWMAGYGSLRLLRDFVLFGCGPVIGLLLARGALWPRGWRHPDRAVLVLAAAALLLPGLLNTAPALRYGAAALPALAALAAAAGVAGNRWLAPLSLVLALWWGAGALRLHDGAHPRLRASLWLWQLPRGTVLLNETAWDDALPAILRLPGETERRWPTHDGHFTLTDLDIVAPDTAEKAGRIAALVGAADFLILSSGRQSEVMPRLPKRFPMTTEWYRLLDSGAACLTEVLRLDRGYPLPGLAFDDRWAQEPWRIYDHPIVRIFARSACFDAAALETRLRQALTAAPSP